MEHTKTLIFRVATEHSRSANVTIEDAMRSELDTADAELIREELDALFRYYDLQIATGKDALSKALVAKRLSLNGGRYVLLAIAVIFAIWLANYIKNTEKVPATLV